MRKVRLVPVRWSILGCLFGFSLFGYVQRTGIAIAAEPMMQDLGLDQVTLGWLLTAFLIGYTAFQIPGGVLGEYWGPRRTLTWMSAASLLATVATAITPRLASGAAMIAILIGARLLLGATQGGLFPVASGAIKNWLPVRNWGFAQGFLITGAWLGSAITPPIVSAILLHFGWREALAAVCVPSALLLIWWHYDARDRPAEHPAVGAAGLADLSSNLGGTIERLSLSRIVRVLVDRQVLLLTSSYFLMNYVFYLVTFWSFLYLRQERHMTTLESGWLASLPFLSAAVASAAGGQWSDSLILRFGVRWGTRILPLIALPFAGLFLWLTGAASTTTFAVAALCLSFGWCELVEGPYWSATMRLAPADSMAATAVLNTGGNLGGVIATPAIAALSANHQWQAIFALGAATSLGAAVMWLWVDVGRTNARSEEI
jgi:ACS family glucarate transporter-like MFS transporter